MQPISIPPELSADEFLVLHYKLCARMIEKKGDCKPLGGTCFYARLIYLELGWFYFTEDRNFTVLAM
jgi:hypothetical protein